MSSWVASEGASFPLGATWLEEQGAYNFALYSQHAESVTLLLYKEDDIVNPVFIYPFDALNNKSGRFWHCRIPRKSMRHARYYAYSIAGPARTSNGHGHNFDSEKILLDPYARSIVFPASFDRKAAMQPGSNAGKAPLGLLSEHERPFDWTGDRRPRHESDLIIYELHVKGFTYHPHSRVSSHKRGTYAGLIEKISYLKELGITAVELMPVFQYDPQEGNYWGYMPINFFTPHHAYARVQTEEEPRNEFREMVKAFHAADIEVILDVVYNHTGEGDHNGPMYSFKGIDSSTYYLTSDDPVQPYLNFTGTGNTFHTGTRLARRLILDSLRYWVKEMHVDGFRFDLASIFARKTDGSLDLEDPPLFGDITSDPDLSNVRLIAEPWDATGVDQLGRSFPGIRWFQWNSRFRDDLRRFVKSDPGLVSTLMVRLYGSDDLFPDGRMDVYHPYQSVNYVTCHDGFTLYDLTAYDQKRNWANGHHNLDGEINNYSWNCGWEGDESVPPEVMVLRKRQIKNYCCILLLSNGTPMIRAGDEFMHTQGGNNNPYNQDNETSWLDWDRLITNRDIFTFVQRMIAFRKSHPSLCRSRFWRHDVRWYGVGPTVDPTYHSHSLAFYLSGISEGDKDLYVMINTYWEPLHFVIQEESATQWKRVIDTSLNHPEDLCESGAEVRLPVLTYLVQPRSVVVLVR
jgi:isoamylase